ncbi:anthranilate synthase component 1 [Actinomyces sp. 594]|uniref:anthranilate synthase component 1 n=1 Tax=Actinomyces sp. 594 TaxID=2057793 RepID=UPI001C5648AA|nr:anthranilate synthase component 1 [Actinomyces sp. 594]MBW3070107.1 anthranilate synthase component 1 [Actinomyces sp. 594]
MTLPPPAVLTRSVRYQHDGGTLLEHLARRSLISTTVDVSENPRPLDAVLLESVDIATKVSRTTIAVLEASARLTCQGHTVVAEALPQASADGTAALDRLRAALPAYVTADTGAALTLAFPAAPDAVEERERLKATSTIEPLRVLAATAVDHPHLPLEAGVFAFDYLATFEALPEVAMGANTCPDYLFYDARIILVIDHPTRTATLVGASVDAADLAARLDALAAAADAFADQVPAADAADPTPAGRAAAAEQRPPLHAVPTQSDSDYAAAVETMKESIAAGDVYQVVPARGFTLPCPDALAAYHALRQSNPSPYMFYVGAPDFELLGASPESALLHSAKTGQVAIRPIAGTRPRGLAPDGAVNHELDTRLELELRTDAKEVAEHVMLVDLARNDVARVSVPGTRRVEDLLRVDRYSRVMHLVSEVSGQLAPDLDALDAFRASMTMGTLTGAPKLRAAELIRDAEGVRRGSYGGSVGYFRGDGELDTCIVIRSAFVREGTALVQAGAGVVADSVPAAEAAETVHKASAVLAAVAASQGAELVIDTGAADAPVPAATAPEARH